VLQILLGISTLYTARSRIAVAHQAKAALTLIAATFAAHAIGRAPVERILSRISWSHHCPDAATAERRAADVRERLAACATLRRGALGLSLARLGRDRRRNRDSCSRRRSTGAARARARIVALHAYELP